MVEGKYEVPWAAEVAHKDGRACGFEPPEREYKGEEPMPPMPPRSELNSVDSVFWVEAAADCMLLNCERPGSD